MNRPHYHGGAFPFTVSSVPFTVYISFMLVTGVFLQYKFLQMKKILLAIALYISAEVNAQQNVGIGTSNPAATAKLDVSSTSQGMLLPRMTSAQREAISFPAVGLLVYDTDKGTLAMFDGIKWRFFYSTDKESELGASELVYPVPNEVKPGDGFGEAVDISGDFAVVGSPTDTVAGLAAAGSFYIFSKTGGGWVAISKLTSPDGPVANTHFGKAVAIDGDKMIVTSPYRGGTGAAYFYKYINGIWQYTAKLTAGDALAGDVFGYSVSMHNGRMAIGAPYGDNYGVTNSGSVYTYTWNVNTQTWNAGAKIIASTDLVAGAAFGISVAIDSNKLLVGAPYYDLPTAIDGGAAYYFFQTGNIWSNPVKLTNPNEKGDNDYFGQEVKITGWRAYISSPRCYNANNTRGRVFSYIANDNGISTRDLYDCYPDKDLSPTGLDLFGEDIAAEGEHFLIGISNANSNPVNSSVGGGPGMAYLVRDRYIEKVLLPPSKAYQGWFGKHVEMDKNSFIISEPGTGFSAPGRVYIYSY